MLRVSRESGKSVPECQLRGSFPELSLLHFFDAPNLCPQHKRIYLPLICLPVYIYSIIPVFIVFLFLIHIFSYIHVNIIV